MSQTNERDQYAFLAEQQKRQLERVEKVNLIALDELEIGDRLSVVARHGRYTHENHGFVLEVTSKRSREQAENRGVNLSFQYTPGVLGFAFCSEEGDVLVLDPGSTLESGFSSMSTRRMLFPPANPDYDHIKTGETYWFSNAGRTGQIAIATHIRSIGILRKATA